ncbi:MAG TPA: energy transducer TonB [Oleiagrimonas sp.]|nr:energy transducer TonB [Oleiagrimonas sp.]
MSALVILAIIVAVAVAAWFLIIHPHRQATQSGRMTVSAGKPSTGKAAPPPADVAAMSNSQLLSEASKAIKDQRLLAPEGNNAFEFYLKVLDRQPDNQVAKDALREIFPFAANAAEQVINRGRFAEAEREIGLLAKAAPDNYTLTILRSKLDARRRVAAHQQEAEQLAQQKQAAAALAAARAQAAAKAKEAEQARQLAAKQAKQLAAAKAAAKARQTEAANQPQPAEKAKVVIHNAVLVQQVTPRYPPAAARMRQRGWVEVQFTVGVDGKVHHAHVVEAQPTHVFDHAAVSAVSQWQYKPATRNGKPIPVTMRQRIEFKLQR